MTDTLILESYVAHPLVLVGIIVLIVIFLLLYLVYRERRQHAKPQQNIIINNFAPMINKQIVRQSSDKSMNEDSAVPNGDDKKNESPAKVEGEEVCTNTDGSVLRHRPTCKTSPTDANSGIGRKRNASGLGNEEVLRQQSCDNNEASGLQSSNVSGNSATIMDSKVASRRRNTSGPGSEENSQRVFNKLQQIAPFRTEGKEKAFVHGVVPYHDGKTKPDTLDEFEMGCTKSQAANEVPTFKSESSIDSFEFKVNRGGCRVVTKYCKLFIPPNSVEEPELVTMTPNYKMTRHSPHRVIITPYVTFKTHSGKELKFTEDVILSLFSGYSPVDGRKSIPVQVLCRKDSSSPLKCIAKAFLGHEKFISFTCRHFSGYCAAAEQEDFHSMRRHYYFAGYVRESTSTTRILHWMILEDCPALLDRMVNDLERNNKERVMDPESFHVDYGYKLQMVVKEHQISPGEDGNENVDLTELWGSRVNLTHQVEMTNICGRINVNLKVKYGMFALHSSGVIREVRNKHFYYEWKVPPPEQPVPPSHQTINVHKDGIGVQYNMHSKEQHVQHQESFESTTSGHSSGYGSPPVSANRTFSLNEGNETGGLRNLYQNFGFNDQRVTMPKALEEFGCPEHHSTPNRNTNAHENESRVERAGESSNVVMSALDNSGMEPIRRSSCESPVTLVPHMQRMTDDASIAGFPSERDSGLEIFHAAQPETDSRLDGGSENDSVPVFSVEDDSGLEYSHMSPSQHAGFDIDCGADGDSNSSQPSSEENIMAPTSDITLSIG